MTGAGGGIGEAYARGLAAAGARVVVAEIDRAAGARVAGEIASGGGEAIAVVADVGAPDSTRAMAEEAAQRFGGIDCLVNNAAIFGGMKPAPFVVNGALLCACACVPPPPMRCPEIDGIPSRQGSGPVRKAFEPRPSSLSRWHGWRPRHRRPISGLRLTPRGCPGSASVPYESLRR